jgi:hypothetical protein
MTSKADEVFAREWRELATLAREHASSAVPTADRVCARKRTNGALLLTN